MATPDLVRRFNAAYKDLGFVVNAPTFTQIRSNNVLFVEFSNAKDLADKWAGRAGQFVNDIDDLALTPLVVFIEQIVAITDRRQLSTNETIPDGLRRATSEFMRYLPLLIYAVLESSGVAGLSSGDFIQRRDSAIADIGKSLASSLDEARAEIRKSAEGAVADFELAKEKASRISVDSAQRQFQEAGRELSRKGYIWAFMSGVLFLGLVWILWRFTQYPPPLIRQIVDSMRPGSAQSPGFVSVPLLIAASAYFTSIRLALIGVLGIGLAFSLKMTRAYLHMMEHNQHKLRVTNSIEAFVAAVRTKEQKDLVLGKLVESVIEFGDSGILGKQTDGPALPSVIIEALTKNMAKDD